MEGEREQVNFGREKYKVKFWGQMKNRSILEGKRERSISEEEIKGINFGRTDR